jgi:hypothetical protein
MKKPRYGNRLSDLPVKITRLKQSGINEGDGK